MGKLAPAKPAPHTREHVLERLAHWRNLLMEHDRGLTNCTLRRVEITRQLDTYLDELSMLTACEKEMM